MYRRWNTPCAVGFAAIAAMTLALTSVRVERVGPACAAYGNVCGSESHDPCYKPVLKGGFPFAFLYDAPGVSVERQLAFIEDKLDAGSLILDTVIYFAVCMLGWRLRQRTVR